MLKSSPHSDGSSFKIISKLGKTLGGHVEESNIDCNAEKLGAERLCRALPLSRPTRELGSLCVCWPTAGAVPPAPTHLRPRPAPRDAELRRLQVPKAVTGQHSSGPVPSGGSPHNPRAAPSFRQAKQPRCGRPPEAPGRAPRAARIPWIPVRARPSEAPGQASRAARIPWIPVRARCSRPAPSAGPRHCPGTASPAPPVPGTTRTGPGSLNTAHFLIK